MPSYKLTINFVSGIADNFDVVAEGLEKNKWIGIFIDGVEADRFRTNNTGTLDYNQTIPSEYQADLLNHSQFALQAPVFPTSGVIGGATLDSITVEFRYV